MKGEYPRFFIPKDPTNTTGAIWIVDSSVSVRFKSNKYDISSYLTKENTIRDMMESKGLTEINEQEAALIL